MSDSDERASTRGSGRTERSPLRRLALVVRPRSESSACRTRAPQAEADSLRPAWPERAPKSRVPLDEVQGTTRVSLRQPKWVPPLPVVRSREALVFTAFGATWAKPLLEVVAPIWAVLIGWFRAQASLRSAFDVSLRLRRFPFRGLRPRAAVTCDSDTCTSGRGGFTPPGLARASAQITGALGRSPRNDTCQPSTAKTGATTSRMRQCMGDICVTT